MTLKMAKGIKEIEDSTKIGTVTPDDIKKQNLLVEEETLKRQKKLAETAKVRIDKSGGGKIAYDFSGFEDPKIDMEELARLDAEMKKEFGVYTPKRTRQPSLNERMSAAFD